MLIAYLLLLCVACCSVGGLEPQISADVGAWFHFANESATDDHPGPSPYTAIAVSSDGSRMVAAVRRGRIYVSDDAGLVWSAAAGTQVPSTPSSTAFWQTLTSSDDGKYIFGCQYDYGFVYSSSDYGATFLRHENLGTNLWSSIKCSNDCMHVYIVIKGGNITRSSDRGVTWKYWNPPEMRAWNDIACSSDGS